MVVDFSTLPLYIHDIKNHKDNICKHVIQPCSKKPQKRICQSTTIELTI